MAGRRLVDRAVLKARGGRCVVCVYLAGCVAQRWTAPAGVPALSGVVEYVTQNPYDALVRLDKPGPGVAALGAFSFPGGGPTMVAMNFYL